MTRACLVLACAVVAMGCGDGGGGSPDSGSDAGPPDGGVDGSAPDCVADPTSPGCPTCEEDPSPAWCATCETDVSVPGCPFDEPTFDGPTADVEILRDALGVQHVYASTDGDALYGQGYAAATDRLLQMELTRRAARGTLAEVLGESQVAQDELMRRLRLVDWGRATAERLGDEHPDVLELVAAWVAGINARLADIDAGDAALPYGFGPEGIATTPAPWTVLDVFACTKLLAFSFANSLLEILSVTLLEELLPETADAMRLAMPVEATPSLPPEEVPGAPTAAIDPAGLRCGQRPAWTPALPDLRTIAARLGPRRSFASNNWALDGRHTDSGRPLVANDGHLSPSSPIPVWPSHVNSADADGALDVIGVQAPGIPLIAFGHNRRVAWGVTSVNADTMDLYDVAVRDGVASIAGRGVPVLTETQTIAVRDAEPVEIEVERVPGVGVLLPTDFFGLGSFLSPILGRGHRLLLAWTGFDTKYVLESAYRANIAADVDELDAAVADAGLLPFNFVGADANGIFYRSGLSVPDRGDPAIMPAPYRVLDGEDPDAWWTGELLPEERTPHSRGGARGWLATANNDPFGFVANGEITDDPWYYGYSYAPGMRVARIGDELERLTARGGVTEAEMRTLQLDTRSGLADHTIPLLDAAWERVPTDPALSEYADRPELARLHELIATEWDRRMERDSSGAVAFEAFIQHLAQAVLGDDLGPLSNAAPVPKLLSSAVLTLEGRYPGSDTLMQPEGRDVLLLTALDRAASWLTERFGGVDPATSPFTWEDLHGVSMPNPVGGDRDVTWRPTDGGVATINVGTARFFVDGEVPERLESTNIPVVRAVYSFDADGTPRGQVVFPLGVSGEPTSPWFDSLHDDWVEGQYHPLRFRRDEIEAEMTERVVLSP